MFRRYSLLVAVFVLNGCEAERLDASSPASFDASFVAMRSGLNFQSDTRLSASVQHLLISEYLWPKALIDCGNASLDELTGRPDAFAAMHGLSRREVVALSDDVARCRDETTLSAASGGSF